MIWLQLTMSRCTLWKLSEEKWATFFSTRSAKQHLGVLSFWGQESSGFSNSRGQFFAGNNHISCWQAQCSDKCTPQRLLFSSSHFNSAEFEPWVTFGHLSASQRWMMGHNFGVRGLVCTQLSTAANYFLKFSFSWVKEVLHCSSLRV